MNHLIATAQALMAPGKGLLAMDESVGTCNWRLAEFGIAQTEESRRRYRKLLVTTPGLSESISGAILFDETLHQNTRDGVSFADVLRAARILVGIKVDAGAKALAGHSGERVTEGLDGLCERLQRDASLGARFAKWRAVLALGVGLPSRACIEVNAHALARYAALCQEAQIVPIVEPGVLMEGAHTLARCAEVTADVLQEVFEQLHRQGVALEAMILKPNMVLPGLDCVEPVLLDDVADAGMTDLGLTSRGEDESRSLAPRLRSLAFAQVLVSPRLRARQTCELAGVAAASELEPALTEWDYGHYEGLRSADIRQERPGWNILRDGCPGGESPADVSERADRLIARLCTTQVTVALFTHGQFGAALAARWIGLMLVEGQHFALNTASVSLLGTDPHHPDRRIIELWNEVPRPEPKDLT